MKKTFFSSVAVLLAVSAGTMLPLPRAAMAEGPSGTQPMMIIQSETLIMRTGDQKCRDLAEEYQQAVVNGVRDLSKLTGRTVTFNGNTFELLPEIARKLDLLGRHELAEKVRDRIASLEFHRRGVCTFA